jgi:hypothetical protein
VSYKTTSLTPTACWPRGPEYLVAVCKIATTNIDKKIQSLVDENDRDFMLDYLDKSPWRNFVRYFSIEPSPISGDALDHAMTKEGRPINRRSHAKWPVLLPSENHGWDSDKRHLDALTRVAKHGTGPIVMSVNDFDVLLKWDAIK